MSKYSFIIPVYNVEKYIGKCLDSILDQSEKDIEVIVIDDGSQDGSGSVCDEYAESDSRIRVIHKQNEGVSVARNIGLDNAHGEWIWFVDSDDYIAEGALEILNEVIVSTCCDTIFFGLTNIDINRKIVNECIPDEDLSSPKNDMLNKIVSYANPTMIFRRQYFNDYSIRFIRGIRLGEDMELQYRYLMVCQKPVSLARSLYYYQWREGSATKNIETLRKLSVDTEPVMNSLLDFMIEHRIVVEDWLAHRIMRLMHLMFYAGYTSNTLTRDFAKSYTRIINKYDKAGFSVLIDGPTRRMNSLMTVHPILARIAYKLINLRRK